MGRFEVTETDSELGALKLAFTTHQQGTLEIRKTWPLSALVTHLFRGDDSRA